MWVMKAMELTPPRWAGHTWWPIQNGSRADCHKTPPCAEISFSKLLKTSQFHISIKKISSPCLVKKYFTGWFSYFWLTFSCLEDIAKFFIRNPLINSWGGGSRRIRLSRWSDYKRGLKQIYQVHWERGSLLLGEIWFKVPR